MIRERFISTAEPELWNRYLPASRSVFGGLGYARICEAFRNSSPRLYVAELGEATICHPMLLQRLADLPFAIETEGRWDATTPDFTGPMLFGNEPDLVSAFAPLRTELLRQEGIVAEFAHLHPWQNSAGLLPEGREYNREVVWVDTQLNPDELWRNHFQHACRKNINTAERHGVRIFEGSSDADIREFHRIYIATMQRNSASPGYHFSYEFFAAFREELSGNCRFVMAEYRDRIVAATLYLHDDNDVVSFLGGADAEFQQIRPTNKVIWETILWAQSTGKKRLILGGGYKPDDGIFRFKATFSPHRKPFYVYRKIHREQDYRTLDLRCREYNAMNGEPISYFPSYRYVKQP